MKSEKSTKLYDRIIICAIDYIKENLEEELFVEDIAQHCHFSKYYFSRLFKQEVGESVYSFIKRLRIEQSALRMIIESNKTITDICETYGYSSSNYSVAFRKYYSKTPSQYKRHYIETDVKEKNGFYVDLTNKSFDYFNEQMRYCKLSDIEVFYQRCIGDYRKLNEHWEKFIDENGLYDSNFSRIEIAYNDPFITEPNRCITDICVATKDDLNIGCNKKTILGGDYLVYKYDGNQFNIFGTFQGLMGVWAPKTSVNIDLERRKIFCMYELVDVENDHYIFDVYIPFK